MNKIYIIAIASVLVGVACSVYARGQVLMKCVEWSDDSPMKYCVRYEPYSYYEN